jgi:hypothetical protein
MSKEWTMAHEPRTANREPGILINWFVVAARGSRLRSWLSFCRDETHSSQLYDSPYDLTRPPTHCRPAADPGPPARATHCASLSPAPHTARRSFPRARALAVPAFPVRSADPTHRPSLASLAHTHTPNATYPLSRRYNGPARCSQPSPHAPALAQVQRACALFAAVTARTSHAPRHRPYRPQLFRNTRRAR